MSGCMLLCPSTCPYGMDMDKFAFMFYILLVWLTLLLFLFTLLVTRISSSGTVSCGKNKYTNLKTFMAVKFSYRISGVTMGISVLT